MTVYERIRKAYYDAQENRFYDAWGIVASPRIIYEMKAECMRDMVLYSTCNGTIETVFGLVIIPVKSIGDDKVYIVDERLGRTILGNTERSE